jgi:ABC-type multidrug transport system fused ATPase/permease subunit
VEAARKGPLELKHVQFTYPLRKDRPVFQDLSLTLPQGSVTALVGRR